MRERLRLSSRPRQTRTLELLEYAVELLANRMQHGFHRSPDHADRLDNIDTAAKAADEELTRRYNETLRDWQESQED